jgi:hypothetical protein
MLKYEIPNPFPGEKEVVIYDLEVYKNYFLATFFEENGVKFFTIEDLNELKEYISDENKVLVGYNNINYDDNILKVILNGENITAEKIYQLSSVIISKDKDDDDIKLIKTLRWYTKTPWISVDLMQLSFTDDSGTGKAGLKELAVRMCHPKIQDLPYDPQKILTNKEKEEVKKYCVNDVMVTVELWKKLSDEVALRLELNQLYNVDVTSYSRPQAAEEILKQQYIKKSGISYQQLRNLKTDIKQIELNDSIPAFIHFITPELQDLLGKIKSTILPIRTIKENNKIKKHVDGTTLKQIVCIAGKTYSFGLGGFHSEDSPDSFVSNEAYAITDLDATSYYPAIIILLGLFPSHLTSIWTNNYKEVTEERIKAKKAGETLKAEAMKIIINSSFGKTGNMYSFMHDPKLMVTVTLTGQLSIMMLIEQMELAGIEVISANTDGISCKVPVDKKAEFELIRGQWEQLTKFQLEESTYKKYFRRDINNYIAEYPDGKLKRKGLFDYGSLYKKNDANVIAIALENYFIRGIPIEETIMSHKNIYDFLHSFKATRGFKIYNGDEELQRINRWYQSNNGGYTLNKIRLSDNQVIKVAKADSIKLINDIKDEAIPEDLNYSYYINEAKEVIYSIENPKKADEVRSLGLYPIPKNFKRNPFRANMSEIKSDWVWGDYNGIACYTGSNAGIIGIDIDYPEVCKIYELFTDTMATWHGNGTASDVLNGRKRGTLIYRCNNDNIFGSDGKFLKKHGFEILYGNKSVQLTGLHDNWETYHYDGVIQNIPPELQKWIIDNLPRKNKRSRKKQKGSALDSDEEHHCSRELLKLTLQRILPEWEYQEIEAEEYKIYGYCPVYAHRDPARTDFNIIFTESGLHCGCFHDKCSEDVAELKAVLNQEYQKLQAEEEEQGRLVVRKEVLEDIVIADLIEEEIRETVEFRTILEAFNQESRVKLISAPTGAGKTYNSVTYFLQCLKSEKFIIYVTSNKTSMQEFVDQIEARTGKKLSELYVQELRRGYSIEESETEEQEAEDDSKNIKESSLGIVTHHTYLTRKGLSNLHYNLLYRIKETGAIVIIDEVDSYVASQTKILELDARYQKKQYKGAPQATYYKKNKCPGSKNKPSCHNCYKLCTAEYDCNRDGIPELRHKNNIKEADFNNITLDLPVLPDSNTVNIPELGLSMCQVQQHRDFLDAKIYKFHLENGELYDLKNTIADMVNCAYNPVIYKYSATLDDNNVSQEDILNMENNDRYRIKYSYSLCEIQYLSLKDESVPHFLNEYCSEVILLSATISENDKDYLQKCFDGKIQDILITESSQKIDELLLIGYGGYLRYIDEKAENKVNINPLMDYGKVLIFEPTKDEAIRLYKKFPQKYPVAKFDRDDISVNEKFSENWKALISHSRGNIGRAVNLPEFYTCFVNTVIYKPSNAYDLKKLTRDEILERQRDDRLTTTVQNAGRILRGTGRKVICLTNVIQDEIEYFKNKFEIMVKSEIKTLYVEEDQDKVFNAIDYYHKTGEVLHIEEYRTIDTLCEKDLSALSKKQRANLTNVDKLKYEQIKEENKKEKREQLIQNKISKGLSLLKAGRIWSDIYKEIRLFVCSSEEKEFVKSQIYESEE